MKFGWVDYLGIIGGLMTLYAFYRLTFKRWRSSSYWYKINNFVGAILLSVYAYEKNAPVSIVINVVWALVASRGLPSKTEKRVKKVVKKETKTMQRIGHVTRRKVLPKYH